MKLKRAGVGNLGAEEVAQTRAKVITRAMVRAEAEALFSDAGKTRAKDQALLKKLFVQTPGAETMSPQLAKTANAAWDSMHRGESGDSRRTRRRIVGGATGAAAGKMVGDSFARSLFYAGAGNGPISSRVIGYGAPLLGAAAGANTGDALANVYHRAQEKKLQKKMAKTSAIRKTALIYGAQVPDEIEHAAIPFGDRHSMFKSYLRDKSREQPTSKLKAIGGGALMGAIPGALLGGALGGSMGGPGKAGFIGAGIGALGLGALGAYGGHVARENDIANITEAGELLKSPKRSRMRLAEHIGERIESRHAEQEAAADARHQELVEELRALRQERQGQHEQEEEEQRHGGRPPWMQPTSYEKMGSVAPHTHAFFDKLAEAALTPAQRRYPELLKASAAPGVGSVTTPSLGKRSATAARGTNPTQSSLSGGAA